MARTAHKCADFHLVAWDADRGAQQRNYSGKTIVDRVHSVSNHLIAEKAVTNLAPAEGFGKNRSELYANGSALLGGNRVLR